MTGECYYCHGLVFAHEANHIVLDSHAHPDVYLHRECAVGHNVVEEPAGPVDELSVRCPECGEVDVR
ncbi:MAG: hypothetical protein ABEJ05_09285 [Haloglomus sp.]